ncbi:cytochrome P450 monooxygenase gliC [Aspergillus foveolatus]|uniref:cytochrome P450 monooxygenase gliC n=1 Tax=Aspergillus foveolatus TaxID=210207 RepID=UPI003CCDE392
MDPEREPHPYALATASVCFVSLVITAVVELIWPGCSPRWLIHPVSNLINAYLEWKYPIRHKTGRATIPSCRYVWPNGQGDAAKFLDGVKNSGAWEKENGSVYRIWSGMKPEIVLTKPHHLQHVFKDSDNHSKAPANNSGFYMSQLLGQCVGLISGSEWRAVRKVAEVPFGHRAISLRLADIERHVTEHFQKIHRDGNLDQGLIHPTNDMKMLPFWVVAELFYGRLPAFLIRDLEKLAPLREHVFKYVIRGGIPRFAWARWLPTAANADLRKFKQAWKAFNKRALEYAQATNLEAPIIQMQAAVAAGEITEEQLLQTLDESLYANLDVTTGGLSWNLVFLAAHRDVQARLRQELSIAIAESRFHAYVADRSSYLAACVSESSRLRPLAAFSVPQAAPTVREVDGYLIPPGTSFIVDSCALNVRNETWGPDNEAYRPERFLGGRDSDRRYVFWRFGFGPRQCMGRHAADMVIRMALAHLVLNYELGLLRDADDWRSDKESWISHPDFWLRCVKRA